MNKKAKIVMICLCGIILTGCNLGKTKLIRKVPSVKTQVDYPVGQITKDVVVAQSFVSNSNVITDVKLFGATYMRDNTANIEIKIYAAPDVTTGDEVITARPETYADYDLVAQWNIKSSEMADNEIIALSIEDSVLDENASKSNNNLLNKRCVLEISSPDGEPDMSPTFWMAEDDFYDKGCLSIAGYDQYNDIWFQVLGVDGK